MSSAPSDRVTNNGLTVSAYAGDGDVLLAFSLDDSLLKQNQLAGFAIQYTPPNGQPTYLMNRLSFSQPVHSGTDPQQHPWTSSQDAPFQKFHWVHFPPDVVPGQYKYHVTARYCQGTTLVDGPSAEISVELAPQQTGNFAVGLTRGYVSSQAYATKFKNAPIRPDPKSLDYDTKPFQPQYEWLGWHARKLVFDLLTECVNDKSITVDMFAYDFDESDILKMCETLGPRLRIFLDNAPLHTGKALEVQVHARLVKSAGAANVKQGHFQRFAHDKIIIQKKNGKAVKVLTGSANFSVRGLYVQANNILVFNDPNVAGAYEQIFESVFNNMSGYVKSDLAKKWFEFPSLGGGIPNFKVSFAPHPKPPMSMELVNEALMNAKSSVMFAIMTLGGAGKVMQTIQKLHLSGKVFSYGMTQSDGGFSLYKPGQPGELVPFAALVKQVPPPFDKEYTGGAGQVIHDKFIVIDFNGDNPVVFTGSSNLADGGESANGDNLLAIYDPAVARIFAAEAIRLVDHYYFRAAVSKATTVSPLLLSACGGQQDWWQRDYDPQNMRNVQRLLFADGPSAVTTIPSGVSDASGGTTAPAKAAKKAPAKAAKKAAKKATKSPAKPKAKAASKSVPKKAAAKKQAAKTTAAKKTAAPKKGAKKSAAKKTKPRTAAKTKRPAKKAAKKTARKARR
ncbi:MAG TPA: phospholipase D-like domain-containing protein [Candidatus Eisenbacteria bacterium]|nr:phospholipase D-like domain-containing protein [Candidatus Eisenbacteria bacterium]